MGNSSRSLRLGWLGLCGALVLSTAGCRCSDEGKEGTSGESPRITVLRVESLSPEKPGAEHCDDAGQNCSPLAPQQKLKADGLVRTFAGGKVSLDFGGGRRVDLDAMSETRLLPENIKLTRGEFSLESTPLAEKEKLFPLRFSAGGKELSTSADVATTTSVSVRDEETLLTVRRGQLSGVAFPDFAQGSRQAGQSLRLANSNVYRTGQGGQELPLLPLLAPRAEEFGGLLTEQTSGSPRGLGTMSARLPNTDQVRDGVILKKHHVRVVIRDGFARTEVEEEFENTTPHVLEGQYRFPVPGDASLSRLALWVGDELIEGEVLEKKRAAAIYKSIVDRPIPRDPALLEWVTGGEMSLKVFPIIPKKSRKVVLAYNQALSTENGVLRYVYPLSLGQGRETMVEDLSISVHLSDKKAQLRNLRVRGYDARLGNEGGFQTVSLEIKGAAPTRDFVVLADRDAMPQAQLSAYVPSWGAPSAPAFRGLTVAKESGADVKGHFALRMSADLPEDAMRPTPLPQDRAVILDVSQSQSRETIVAQAALAYGILREMNPEERFILLACDSACRTFPENGPQNATPAWEQRSLEFLSNLAHGGSSDIAGALVAASAQLRGLPHDARERQVILISDGSASSGDLSAESIARRALPHLAEIGADLRVVGAGRTLDEVTLRGLGRELDATYDRLQSGTSLEERIFEISISLRRPVIRNVSLTLPALLRAQQDLRLPAIRLGQELVITGEILNLTEGQVHLAGSLNGAPYRLTRPIAWDQSSDAQNPLIPRLWAQERIAALQAKEVTPALRDEIIRLSTTHRTMSRFTSFLVLESEKMYRDFGVERSTHAESDQPDAAFSDLDFNPPASQGEAEREARTITSFEALADDEFPMKKEVASKSAPSRMRPPASAPLPKAKKPSSSASGSADIGLGALEEKGFGPMASGSATGRGSSEADRSLSPTEEMPVRRPIFHPPPPPFRPRAHLAFQQANDDWRKWGEQNLLKLAESLQEDDKSRARHEAYIRGHLKQGRFPEARKGALRFIELDPDYAPARKLLAYAAVVDGDHELSRLMLDIQAETAPHDPSAHAESARSFEVAGDIVRACAHYRALAELAPGLVEAVDRARSCWEEVLGKVPSGSTKAVDGKAGQLQIEVKCEAGIAMQDCPSPVVVTPDGSVVSPWTPGTGRSSRFRVTFEKLRSGDYFVLVLGGAPHAQGTVTFTGRKENQSFKFQDGGMHTVAKTTVSFW